ncbi:hypothetical protein O4H61_06285 [Roseovarius aestuarii]|nr:hypothetical protein [Roseovarius aestuarii]
MRERSIDVSDFAGVGLSVAPIWGESWASAVQMGNRFKLLPRSSALKAIGPALDTGPLA